MRPLLTSSRISGAWITQSNVFYGILETGDGLQYLRTMIRG
jgi:hypothetical protein